METLVFWLYVASASIFALYFLGWCVFRLRRGYINRTLKRSLHEIEGEQPSYGMSKGVCNVCGTPVTYDKEKRRWKHDSGKDVYHHCHGCDLCVNGDVEPGEKCPKCGKAFDIFCNIVCEGLPVLTFWPSLWRKIKWKVEAALDWIDGYYNHQKWGFTVPNALLFLKDFFYNRYHVVKCRELDCRFHEPGDVMPHAMFELLRIYVEEEDPWILETPEEFEPDPDAYYAKWEDDEEKQKALESDKYHHSRRLEIKHLYLWWTKTRHERQKEYDILFDSWDASGSKRDDPENRAILERTWKMEEEMSEELKDAMRRLVNIHESLWR